LSQEEIFIPGPQIRNSQKLPQHMNDHELNNLFASCIPKLARFARRLMRNPQDSEDALQEGLLSAFQNLHQFQGRSTFSTWMHSIVRNAAMMHLRRMQSRSFSLLEPQFSCEETTPPEHSFVDSGPSPEEACVQAERSRILRSTMKELPRSYRRVVQLCDIDGLEGRNVAASLGLTVSSFKTCLHRARRSVARRIQQTHSHERNESFGQDESRVERSQDSESKGTSRQSSEDENRKRKGYQVHPISAKEARRDVGDGYEHRNRRSKADPWTAKQIFPPDSSVVGDLSCTSH
jgi:RNA polymerase sigma-70 factor (ECF subfamily)